MRPRDNQRFQETVEITRPFDDDLLPDDALFVDENDDFEADIPIPEHEIIEGDQVDMDKAKVGDIVFFDNFAGPWNIGHVGVVIEKKDKLGRKERRTVTRKDNISGKTITTTTTTKVLVHAVLGGISEIPIKEVTSGLRQPSAIVRFRDPLLRQLLGQTAGHISTTSENPQNRYDVGKVLRVPWQNVLSLFKSIRRSKLIKYHGDEGRIQRSKFGKSLRQERQLRLILENQGAENSADKKNPVKQLLENRRSELENDLELHRQKLESTSRLKPFKRGDIKRKISHFRLKITECDLWIQGIEDNDKDYPKNIKELKNSRKKKQERIEEIQEYRKNNPKISFVERRRLSQEKKTIRRSIDELDKLIDDYEIVTTKLDSKSRKELEEKLKAVVKKNAEYRKKFGVKSDEERKKEERSDVYFNVFCSHFGAIVVDEAMIVYHQGKLPRSIARTPGSKMPYGLLEEFRDPATVTATMTDLQKISDFLWVIKNRFSSTKNKVRRKLLEVKDGDYRDIDALLLKEIGGLESELQSRFPSVNNPDKKKPLLQFQDTILIPLDDRLDRMQRDLLNGLTTAKTSEKAAILKDLRVVIDSRIRLELFMVESGFAGLINEEARNFESFKRDLPRMSINGDRISTEDNAANFLQYVLTGCGFSQRETELIITDSAHREQKDFQDHSDEKKKNIADLIEHVLKEIDDLDQIPADRIKTLLRFFHQGASTSIGGELLKIFGSSSFLLETKLKNSNGSNISFRTNENGEVIAEIQTYFTCHVNGCDAARLKNEMEINLDRGTVKITGRKLCWNAETIEQNLDPQDVEKIKTLFQAIEFAVEGDLREADENWEKATKTAIETQGLILSGAEILSETKKAEAIKTSSSGASVQTKEDDEEEPLLASLPRSKTTSVKNKKATSQNWEILPRESMVLDGKNINNNQINPENVADFLRYVLYNCGLAEPAIERCVRHSMPEDLSEGCSDDEKEKYVDDFLFNINGNLSRLSKAESTKVRNFINFFCKVRNPNFVATDEDDFAERKSDYEDFSDYVNYDEIPEEYDFGELFDYRKKNIENDDKKIKKQFSLKSKGSKLSFNVEDGESFVEMTTIFECKAPSIANDNDTVAILSRATRLNLDSNQKTDKKILTHQLGKIPKKKDRKFVLDSLEKNKIPHEKVNDVEALEKIWEEEFKEENDNQKTILSALQQQRNIRLERDSIWTDRVIQNGFNGPAISV